MNKVSLGNLKRYVILFVMIGVVGTVGLDIMSTVQGQMYNTATVENETFNATADPYTYTVAEASSSGFHELSTVTVYDTVDQASTLDASITNASTGEITVNGAVDEELESLEYSFEEEDSQARQGAENAITGMSEILGFLPVIGLVVAAAVVIGLVSGFGGSSRKRGRA